MRCAGPIKPLFQIIGNRFLLTQNHGQEDFPFRGESVPGNKFPEPVTIRFNPGFNGIAKVATNQDQIGRLGYRSPIDNTLLVQIFAVIEPAGIIKITRYSQAGAKLNVVAVLQGIRAGGA